MNVDFVNIRNYLENKDENIFIKIFLYCVIIGIFLILIVVFSAYNQKKDYYENVILFNNNHTFLIVDSLNLENIVKNQKVIINNKVYKYKIINILASVENSNYQVQVLIDYDKYFLDNEYIEYKILIMEESYLKYFVRTIKGG